MRLKNLMICGLLLFSVGLVQARTVEVSTVKELIEAIAPNTTIELAPGTYNISEVAGKTDNDYIQWVNEYDGDEPFIRGVDNLTINGSSNAIVVIEPRYAWVMNFGECNNLTFNGVTFGHTDGGYCLGGVLRFAGCQNIDIKDCPLYGSGTVGLEIDNCKNVTVENCDIYECTYGLVYMYNSDNVTFTNTSFRNTGQFDLIEIINCNNVTFMKCSFSGNHNGEFMPYFFTIDENTWTKYSDEDPGFESKNIEIKKCTFTDNKVQKFANDESKLTLKGNKFTGNDFKTPKGK